MIARWKQAAMIAAALFVAAGFVPARAQSADRVFRLGHQSHAADSEILTRALALPELARFGFVENRNLSFDSRVGPEEALAGLMRELLAARPDVIVAIGPAVLAASRATRSVPIVSFGADVVELGLAASFARPAGNVTGVAILAGELDAKRLHLLVEAIPGRRRVAALLDSAAPASRTGEAELRDAAVKEGVEIQVFAVATPVEYAAAFEAMRAAGAQSLVISASPQFNRDAPRLAKLALDARLPTICEWADMARAGCLLGYGPNRPALRRRMADQIARIFRGTPPGEIAVELPTLFEFSINLNTARALGVELAAAILARADEVIE